MAETGLSTAARYVNIRENAGWSAESGDAAPKMAALLAAAQVPVPDVATVDVVSGGVCLVYGPGDVAMEVGRLLHGRLNVAILMTDPGEAAPQGAMDMMIASGVIAGARGHIGDFEINVNGYSQVRPSARAALDFGLKQDGAAAKCDLIVDLSGRAPLFPSHERRDGYYRIDPADRPAMFRTLLDVADMVGEFEKPRYVTFQESLCAHSRSRISGCTRCLDVCPASAIQPNGDHVSIDPYLCGGCGACNSVCPTGAADYAAPSTAALLGRLKRLLATYLETGGRDPVLLVHDPRHGASLIEAMARYGRGLPASVLPFEVNEITQIGVDFLLPALAYGAVRVILLGPSGKAAEIDGLAAQTAVAETLVSGLGYDSGRTTVLLEDDPDRVEEVLYGLSGAAGMGTPATFNPQAEKRTNIRSAALHLHAGAADPVDRLLLPPGAPFGAVAVDVDGCTLCLSCVSACPTGALTDNPDLPQLGFQESACIQCGLCKSTCPEKVITLEPRFSFTPDAAERQVVKEEEPFECISCGKPFAPKSTIEKMVEQLAGKHWMFQGEGADRLKMCEDCRVVSQFDETDGPMAFGERPRPRTTDDYLAERETDSKE